MAVRALSLVGLLAIGCATSPEMRLRHQMVTEIYVDAARACDAQFRSVQMARVGVDGSLSVDVQADQTQDVRGLRGAIGRVSPNGSNTDVKPVSRSRTRSI
jgi:hypothetical protein